jgi:hypothetical protein
MYAKKVHKKRLLASSFQLVCLLHPTDTNMLPNNLGSKRN